MLRRAQLMVPLPRERMPKMSGMSFNLKQQDCFCLPPKQGLYELSIQVANPGEFLEDDNHCRELRRWIKRSIYRLFKSRVFVDQFELVHLREQAMPDLPVLFIKMHCVVRLPFAESFLPMDDARSYIEHVFAELFDSRVASFNQLDVHLFGLRQFHETRKGIGEYVELW
jgi:hypothetical protein